MKRSILELFVAVAPLLAAAEPMQQTRFRLGQLKKGADPSGFPNDLVAHAKAAWPGSVQSALFAAGRQ